MRRNRRTATLCGNALERLEPGLIAQDIPERTVFIEFIDIVKPAVAQVDSGRVGAPPGYVAFGRTNPGRDAANSTAINVPV